MGNVRGKFKFLCLEKLYSASSCFPLTSKEKKLLFDLFHAVSREVYRLSWEEVTLYLY